MGAFRNFPYSNFHQMNLDEIIKIVKTLSEEWTEVQDDWVNFRAFVNNYLANLDVSEEVRKNLEDMLNSGEFNQIIVSGSTTLINEWLEANITNPTNPPLDRSFLLDNAAANSEQVGYIAQPNKNKVNISDYNDTSFTGVVINQNAKTGIIKVTGTATANISPTVKTTNGANYTFIARAGHTYALSGCPSGGSVNTYDLSLRLQLNGARTYVDFGEGAVFTPTEDQTLYLQIRVTTGNGNGIEFKPQIEECAFVTEFVPYSHKSARDTVVMALLDNANNLYNNLLTDGGVVNEMMRVTQSYIDHGNDLSYGQETATHWYINGVDHTKEKLYEDYAIPTEIDCSTLALLVTQGTPYEASKYVGLRDNIIGFAGYGYDIFEGNQTDRENNTGIKSLSYQIAMYARDKGFGFEVNENSVVNIQPGDMLFFSADGHDPEAWLGIDHCEIFLGKATNMAEDPLQPIIVTLNCSGGRDVNPVQINNRGKSFYDGSNPNHRQLVYAARFPIGTYKTQNETIYTRPMKPLITNIPCHIDQYKAVSITFDATINTTGGHFTVYANNVGVVVSKNIDAPLVGKKIRYNVILTAQTEPVETVAIRAINDNNAVIEDVLIAHGVNV